MSNTEAEAQVSFRGIKDSYFALSLGYDPVRARNDELAKETEDDNVNVGVQISNITDAYSTLALNISAPLIAVLQMFGTTIRSEASTVTDLLVELGAYLERTSQAVKSRGTVIGAAADDVGNTGTQTLYINGKLPDGSVNENAAIDDIEYRPQLLATSLNQLGVELYEIKPSARSEVSEFDGPGIGVEEGTLQSIGPGRSPFFNNASFDQAFRNNAAAAFKIPGVEITAGAANIASTTVAANIAEDRGGTHRSLEITGPCTFQIDFLANGIALTDVVPFIMGLRAKTTGNTDIDMTLGSVGAATPYTGTINIVGAQPFDEYTIDPDTETAWAEIFDEDGRPILVIDVTAVAGTLHIDDLILDTQDTVGGLPTSLIAGLIRPGRDDVHTQARTLTVGAGTFTLSGGAAGDTVDSILIDGIELLRESIPFTTDLETTVGLVVDHINTMPTAPDYEATNDVAAGEFTVKQRKPVEGALTAAITVTDNGGLLVGTPPADLSGASIGEIQDFVVRHAGVALPHEAAATAGYED